MDLVEPVQNIKELIRNAFHKRLVRLGIREEKLNPRDESDRNFRKAQSVIEGLQNDGMDYPAAREKYLEEVTFTLFNRLAGLKAMEVHQLIPEVVMTRSKHGNRSFAHQVWLEENPEAQSKSIEGLDSFIKDKFSEVSEEVNLYNRDYPYDLLPDVYDLKDIITAFNEEISEDKWKEDDILGWMYEAYNKQKYKEFKDGGQKVEYDKLSLASQMYTPSWVVEFLVDNSLGKLWLEINPESQIKDNHDIANAPEEAMLDKELEEIKILDPAVGSGNFLLYAFDLLYEIYEEEGYSSQEIPELILENNLYGIDIDERAVQIARLQLYIKAKRKSRRVEINTINVVSSDFYLPEFEEVKDEYFTDIDFAVNEREFTEELWSRLREAHKFGSLVRLQEGLEDFVDAKQKQNQLGLFDDVTDLESFEKEIVSKIKEAIIDLMQQPRQASIDSILDGDTLSFLNYQTSDALEFAELMLSKYDIVVANPPYTDSSNYGKELKKFVKDNYREQYDFYKNLYACFIKQNSDLLNKDGKMGMIHPETFMYIKSYQEMRKFIINNLHIDFFIEWGYLGIFTEDARVGSAIYILEKNKKDKKSVFVKLDDLNENKRKNKLFKIYKKYVNKKEFSHKRLYLVNQDKLKLINGFPFIYWISDSFREKFKEKPLEEILDVKVGLQTGNNYRFLRFWWEVNNNKVSKNYSQDEKKWVPYQKGGDYNKWYGNNWLVVNWKNDGYEIKNLYDDNGRLRSRPQNEEYYFKEGITYTLASTKGISMRYLSSNNIFDVGGSCIFLEKNYKSICYILGLMNSKLASYIVECLNPSVNTQVGDFKRIPFVKPDSRFESKVKKISNQNIRLKKYLCKYSIIEREFEYNPLDYEWQEDITNPVKRLKDYIEHKYSIDTQISLNEAVIDELIFNVYDLTDEDRKMVLEKEGLPVGLYPVFNKDRDNYLVQQEDLLIEVKEFIRELEIATRDREELKEEIKKLYEKNNSIEEISKELELNPISVVQIIKELNSVPKKMAKQISHEFLLDVVRTVLKEDDDGIAILNGYAGEDPLADRVRQKLYDKGFTGGDINKLESFLGKNIKDYLLNKFFKDECDTLNLFMYQPKTPFIWHLSSGKNHGFDAYTLIYEWNRDSVYKLKSYYVDKRETGLKNRLNSLADDDSVDAEKEKDKIRKQLEEIEEFKDKLDQLLDTDYDSKLDDGVGKNIAPLQDLGLLYDNVLTNSQLDKFLNAEW